MVKCETKDCSTTADYGYNYGEAIACSKHRVMEPENLKMVNVRAKRCIKCVKTTDPAYGFEGKERTHCFKCKEPNMINLKNKKKCVKCKSVSPTYGLDRNKPPTHCTKCKTPDMFDVTHKMCIGCNKVRPNFGLVLKKPTHCFDCKTPEMEDVTHNLCEKCNETRPNFGLTKATHCSKCKTNNMKKFSRVCCVCNNREPTYGIDIDKPATHCSKCKTDNMKNTRKMCEGCGDTYPSFGLDINKPPTHCLECKTDDMVSTNKMCLCGKSQPTFGFELKETKEQVATSCMLCAEEGMIDIKHIKEKCKIHLCYIRAVNPQYKGYCLRCFVYTFPEETISRNYKTKETAMVESVMENHKDIEWVWDKKIKGGISLRRPDLFGKLKDKNIILECQESHHTRDIPICVNRRKMELSQDVKHEPTVIIYFNPDSYINEENKRIPSCWSITKETGMLKVSNKNNWEERLKKLNETIDYWKKTSLEKTIEPVELFCNKN